MRTIASFAGACTFALAMGSLLFAGQNKPSGPLTGTWECTAHLSGQDDIPFTMTLDQNGETVTGKIATNDGELEIKTGTYKNGALELHMETDEAKYQVTGNLDGGQFKGKWSKDPDGLAGDWEGKKSAAAKTATPPAQAQ